MTANGQFACPWSVTGAQIRSVWCSPRSGTGAQGRYSTHLMCVCPQAPGPGVLSSTQCVISSLQGTVAAESLREPQSSSARCPLLGALFSPIKVRPPPTQRSLSERWPCLWLYASWDRRSHREGGQTWHSVQGVGKTQVSCLYQHS